MKYKLLAVSTEKELNIGDYVQALASAQFLPSLDGFIQREKLKDYNGDECKVIMNGWYMHHSEQWPPSLKIHPLFVAFHINSLAKKDLLSADSLSYLKKYEPIGCRDTATASLLDKAGIKSYFSGCMTLTLGKKYHSEKKDNKWYFVDPFFKTDWNFRNIIRNFLYLLLYWSDIKKISTKYPENKKGIRKLMILTTFYREYRRFFSREILLKAEYINQQSEKWQQICKTDEVALEEAKKLVNKYARAQFVVTSRIHCALPCLGLETPVIYIEDANQSEASECRLGGLRELFNIMEWEKGKLVPTFKMKDKVSQLNNFPKNKLNWKQLAQELMDRCNKFIHEI